MQEPMHGLATFTNLLCTLQIFSMASRLCTQIWYINMYMYIHLHTCTYTTMYMYIYDLYIFCVWPNDVYNSGVYVCVCARAHCDAQHTTYVLILHISFYNIFTYYTFFVIYFIALHSHALWRVQQRMVVVRDPNGQCRAADFEERYRIEQFVAPPKLPRS